VSEPVTPRRPIRETLAAISTDLLLLVAQLAAIARAEVGVAVGAARGGLVVVTAGAALLMVGALTLVAALVLAAVALGLSPWAAALLIGVLLTLAGGVAVTVGLESIRRVRLQFPETRGALTDGVEWLKTIRR
jgi:hypothetical protein